MTLPQHTGTTEASNNAGSSGYYEVHRNLATLASGLLLNAQPLIEAGAKISVAKGQAWLAANEHESTAWQCIELARIAREAFLELGIRARLIEGDVEVGPGDFVEHRAVMVEQPESIAFVDTSASQFAQFAGSEIVVVSCSPDRRILGHVLRRYYGWR